MIDDVLGIEDAYEFYSVTRLPNNEVTSVPDCLLDLVKMPCNMYIVNLYHHINEC